MIEYKSADVTKHLQKFGLLVGAKISIPSGTYTPNEAEFTDPNTVAVIRDLQKKGPLVMIPAIHLQPLLRLRSRVANKMKSLGYQFPIFSGAYFVMVEDIENISTFLAQDADPELAAEKLVLAGKWDAIKAERIALFNEVYPENAGWLDDKFPEFDVFAGKIRIQHSIINWSPPEIAHVTEIELENYRNQMQEFTASVALEWKKGLVEAVTSFKRALNVKSGKINEGSVEKFRSFLDKMERHNIFEDDDLSTTIRNIKNHVFSNETWMSDKNLRDSISGQLDEFIEQGYSEGEAAAVASKFIRKFADEVPDETEDDTPTGDMPAFFRTLQEAAVGDEIPDEEEE